MTSLRSGTALLVCLAVTACNGDLAFDDDLDVGVGADSVEGTAQTQALLSVSSDAAMGAIGAEMAATVAAQNSGTFFQPMGCLATQRNGATVVYTFTNCTGPYGLVNLNGTVNATFSNVTPTARTVTVTGEVRANRFTLRPNASAQITYMGTTRLATVTLMGGGTSPRGNTWTNAGTYMTSWNGTCLGLSGRVTSTANGASVTVDVSNYNRCRGGCPDAGGRVTVTSSRGASVSVSYSGGATATLTGTRGRSSTVALYCGAT